MIWKKQGGGGGAQKSYVDYKLYMKMIICVEELICAVL